MPHKLQQLYPYTGGKSRLLKEILMLTPPHKTHIEVCGGSCALTLSKPRSEVEVINDRDPGIVNLLRILQHPDTFKLFHHKVLHTEYSCNLIYIYRQTPVIQGDAIETARRFWILKKINFGGWEGHFTDDPIKQKTFKNSIEQYLVRLHERLQGVIIENIDFYDLIERYKGSDSFFYIDPPYHPATRNTTERKKEIHDDYRYEMSIADHHRLIPYLSKLAILKQGNFLLSGYPHPDYDKPLSYWNRIKIPFFCFKNKNKNGKYYTRLETMWFNYDISDENKKWIIDRIKTASEKTSLSRNAA